MASRYHSFGVLPLSPVVENNKTKTLWHTRWLWFATPQLAKLVSQQNAAVLGRTLAPDVVQAVAEMANHGVDPDSIACLLLGALSPDGAC